LGGRGCTRGRSHRRVSGDHAAWVRYEEDLNALNVFAANLETGELTRITELETSGGLMDILKGPQALAISGSKIVWQDARNGVGSEDLYLYDLTVGEEQLLVGAEGSQQSPDLYGDLVVGADTRDDAGDIHLLDLATGQETAFPADGKQKFPKVTNGVVGWVHEDAAIVLHDLATGEETTVPTASGTMHAFDISGSTVAYRLYDEAAEAYGVWISDLDGSNARQVVAPTGGATHFGLYGTTVVFNAQGLHAYDLATDSTVGISDTPSTAFFPQMSGNRIVWQSLNALGERYLTLAQLGPALGDANLDGAVSGADANAIAQCSVGNPVNPFDEGAADVNCDGAITITDALRVAQKANGSLDYFPCELN